jgi:hypothetical protein
MMISGGLVLRDYQNPVLELCQHWFEQPCQSLDVERLSDFSQTADGACRVSFSSGVIGFVKPRPDNQNLNVVANEKLASDLGHLLELPLAPILVRPPMEEWPRYSALSLVCLPQGRHWEQGPTQRTEELDQQLEALRVFWTWIGDVDHGGHPHNLLYEFDGSKFRIVAIDHSYAFGHGDTEPLTAPVSLGYGTLNMSHVVSVRRRVIEMIMALDWSDVEQIFRRLPDELLTVADVEKKLDWIAKRRESLVSLLCEQ